MIRALLMVAIAVLLGCGGRTVLAPSSPYRPAHFDIQLAYPVTLPRLNAIYVSETSEQLYPIRLEIDRKGRVRKATAVHDSDTAATKHMLAALKDAAFVPGTRHGKVVNQLLEAEIWVQAHSTRATVRFPLKIDSSSASIEWDLYRRSLVLNDIHPAAIKKFAPYDDHLRNLPDDTMHTPFVLYRLSLDAQGNISEIEQLRSTAEGDTEPLKIAAAWSDFASARVGKNFLATTCYLLVSLYPQLDYPTQPFTDTTRLHSDPLQRTRLRMVFDTTGLILPAVPKNVRDTIFTLSRDTITFNGTLDVMVRIDTTGQAILTTSGLPPAIRRVCHQTLLDLEFFPAMTLDARPVQFRGVMTIRFEGSRVIGLKFRWLQ